MTNLVELKSAYAILFVDEMVVYQVDESGNPIMGTGVSIDELEEEWFDELTLAENEVLMEVLG